MKRLWLLNEISSPDLSKLVVGEDVNAVMKYETTILSKRWIRKNKIYCLPYEQRRLHVCDLRAESFQTDLVVGNYKKLMFTSLC